MTEAPIRDVVRVEERVGPRGGRTLVLHLSCGCFLTRSSKAPPPTRARCVPCSVLADTSGVDLVRTIEAAVDATLARVRLAWPSIRASTMAESRAAGIRAGIERLTSASARSNSRPNDA